MDYPDDYPAPDPDGRPHIWLDFNVAKPHEWDLGRLASSAGSVKEQHLELGEGLGVVLVDDTGTNGCSSTRPWIGSIRNAIAR